ncbi:mucin-5B-like isoform X4 [Sparus aurata]|uniref:mucin-5B-like isoform X4 n=1 Tax=Sparus aurata TaxID=8175 RepID=UPI0011C104A9|nr:mucin-5B-like isoform X4 [Sparus aurata]
MTSWKRKARLFLLVLLSTIDLSYGGCAEYLKVDAWGGNLTQFFTLVETDDPKDIAECTLEKEAVENNTNAWFILRDCFKKEIRKVIPSEKCKRNTSGTIPFYNFMCLTIATINRKYQGANIEDKHCEYDITCKLLSGGPSTATPTTLPERTEVTPTWTTTELPPTTTNFTQITATPTTLPERTEVTPTWTTTELPPTTNFTQITVENPLANVKENPLTNEKENLALKIFSVISAALNMAALMVFLYQRKRNTGFSHEPVATYMSDGASLEAQRMTELCTVRATVNGHVVETTHLIKTPESDSISTHSPPIPNGCHVGNEE